MELKYNELAIDNSDELVYGVAPRPLATRGGLTIGGGTVYPELNFTLPPMLLSDKTFAQARGHYPVSYTHLRAHET